MAQAYGPHNVPILYFELRLNLSIPFHLRVCLLESSCKLLLAIKHVDTHIDHLNTFQSIQSRLGSVAFLI